MGKHRNRKRYAVIRSSPSTKKTRKNFVGWASGLVLAMVPTAIAMRSTNMDSVNVLLIALGVLVICVSVKYSEFPENPWKYLRICQRRYVWWPVVMVTAIFFLCWIWHVHKEAPLRGELSRIVADEEARLEKEYPLGYVMIAFSGHKKIVLPRTNRMRADWDNMKVYMDEQNNISVDIPYLYDMVSHSSLENCALGTPAIPGSSGRWGLGSSLVVHVECVRANPIGIFAVLGFNEQGGESKR
jgi:hypothetical protein